MGTRIAALLLLVTFALSAHAINDMFISQQAEPKGVIFAGRRAYMSSLLAMCDLQPDLTVFATADMHDGDQKIVDFHDEDDKKGTVGATIKPYGNNETWVVEVLLHFNKTVVSGIVDFNVKGKPSPPPVNLSVELWYDLESIQC